MEIQEILSIVAQVFGLLFALVVGVILVISMKRDGVLTATETSKVVIIGLVIYATIENATRPIDTLPVFDTSTYLIMLGSLLALAGIDVMKTTNFIKDLNKKNSGKSN